MISTYMYTLTAENEKAFVQGQLMKFLSTGKWLYKDAS